MGLPPIQTDQGWKLVLEGTVTSRAVTYTFQVAGSASIYMDPALGTNGDGYVNRSTGFVRLCRAIQPAEGVLRKDGSKVHTEQIEWRFFGEKEPAMLGGDVDALYRDVDVNGLTQSALVARHGDCDGRSYSPGL